MGVCERVGEWECVRGWGSGSGGEDGGVGVCERVGNGSGAEGGEWVWGRGLGRGEVGVGERVGQWEWGRGWRNGSEREGRGRHNAEIETKLSEQNLSPTVLALH